MKIKIPENSKLFLSKLGAKGFLYPSEDCILAPTDLMVSEVNYVYSKEYGVIPVKVVDMGAVPLSDGLRTTIFWVEKSHFGK